MKFNENRPIAVFKDHKGVVCSLNFFNVPFYNNGERKLRKGLASASDDGSIKIYFEEDFSKINACELSTKCF